MLKSHVTRRPEVFSKSVVDTISLCCDDASWGSKNLTGSTAPSHQAHTDFPAEPSSSRSVNARLMRAAAISRWLDALMWEDFRKRMRGDAMSAI
jgi:hypothetical protein